MKTNTKTNRHSDEALAEEESGNYGNIKASLTRFFIPRCSIQNDVSNENCSNKQ